MSGQIRRSGCLFVVFLVCVTFVLSRADILPCGICGVDVICKERYPICSKNQIIALDHCGCCLVCKSILEKGEECSKDIDLFAICKAGLECINSKCTDPNPGTG